MTTTPDATADDETQAGLFDGDTGDAPADARMVITYLTRNRVLLGRDHPHLWDALIEHEAAVTRHFHNMYVDLIVHSGSKVAFKSQITPERVSFSVTVRAVTLTLEASVLALYVRERVSHAIPGEMVTITRTEARTQMDPYWPAHVSNKAAKEKKVNGALDALVAQDLLHKLDVDQWEVSPAVPLVFTAQAISRFTDLLTAPEAHESNADTPPHLEVVPDSEDDEGPADDDELGGDAQ